MPSSEWSALPADGAIALIGMAGRFPGARTVARFWQNLLEGRESISRLTDDELLASGIDPAHLADPRYVKARALLDDAELFDASFFGFRPRDAELMDPQHRLFLETCWEALEDAGYTSETSDAVVGVYGGASLNTYLLWQLCRRQGFAKDLAESYQIGSYPAVLGNDAGFLTTRVSYKLNLKGPSLDLQTGCSTSLAAVCVASGALLARECDLALAGGVSVSFPQKRGYFTQEGGMGSPDGRCRPFDAAAAGTVFGSGVGVVVLKRLEDALSDGDSICAVVRGFALNNDGSGKVGYTAPSAEGQAEVIVRAQAIAGVEPGSIGYVEAHGTATPLGDPIEIAGLTRAFRTGTSATGFCALGSVKGNIGHLDAAAGVAGLIKTALALRNGKIPATLHFERPNPEIDFASSPFYVAARTIDWERGPEPRRAGVSAFGVGGTNAHVVLEEPPRMEESRRVRRPQLLVLSARTPEALDSAADRLANHLAEAPKADLADTAYTLQIGRRAFEHRRCVLAEGPSDAVEKLRSSASRLATNDGDAPRDRPVVFLFPGQGSQYAGMGRDTYRTEPVFREEVDLCAEILHPLIGFDLRKAFGEADTGPTADLDRSVAAQPAIFVLDYALARLWESWGIRASAVAGHSVGEFAAACVAGVFTLEDALRLVAERACLLERLPAGGMLAVKLEQDRVEALLRPGLSLAAVNAPSLSVISGDLEALADLEQELSATGVPCSRLRASRAFHSPSVEPVTGPFLRAVERVARNEPRLPWLSTMTGTWMSAEQAIDPNYWAQQMRRTVRFGDALAELARRPERLLLEVGPGRTLTNLAQHVLPKGSRRLCIGSLPDAQGEGTETRSLVEAVGRVWLAGARVDWKAFHAEETLRRVSLPTYPFERRRCWLDSDTNDQTEPEGAPARGPERQRVSPAATTASGEPRGPAAAPRRVRILERIVEIVASLSGLPRGEISDSASFLEMGFDSLFLTQVSQRIEKEFKVRVPFRRLLEESATPGKLAETLDGDLSPEVECTTSSVPAAAERNRLEPPAAARSATGAEQSVLDRLAEQVATMSRQIEELRSAGAASPAEPGIPRGAAPEAGGSRSEKPFPAFGPYKPIEKSGVGALTERQHRYVTAFSQRYAARTAGSKRRTERDRSRLADPRVAAGFRREWKEIVYPIVAARSAGSRLWDVDGNEYIDLLMGFGLNLFGHSPSFVTKALREQLDAGVEIGPQSPLAGPVAQKIAEMTGIERVSFCNTGSEAVMAAVRLARTVTGQRKIALFAGSYHGTFDEVLVRAARPDGRSRPVPIAPGIPQEKVDNVLVLEYGSEASLAALEASLPELAAVLVEPVQSRHPDLQPREFLQELRRMTRREGTALIFDEVITGFRIHPGGAQAWFGVQADLVTYGKVVGGGMPIGIIGGRAQFMDALDGGAWRFGDDSVPEVGVTFFAGTFVRHPLALAAASAVLDHLKSAGPALQRDLNLRADRFVRSLNDCFERNCLTTRAQHCGSILYFGFPSEQRLANLLYPHLRSKGVHILEGFPCFLTTAHTDEDLARVLTAFEESIAEMQAGGLLPEPGSRVETVSLPDLAATAKGAGGVRPQSTGDRSTLEFPLTASQREVWLAAQMAPEASCAFNESLTVSLEGPLEQEALRESLAHVVSRHEALRTTFDPSGERQRVLPVSFVEVALEDASSLDPEAQKKRLTELVEIEARTPFDLAAGPLLRAVLIRLSSASHRLVLTAHHLVCDGWSTNVILQELGETYSALVTGRTTALPDPPRFSDYAAALVAFETGPEAEETERYWLHSCALPVPVLDLPLDHPRPSAKTFAGATERRRIPAETVRALQTMGAKQGATLFATLLAAFEVLLHRLTGQEDLIVGIPSAGQAAGGKDGLVGHCVHFLPFRSRPTGDASFRDHLRETRGALLDAYEHQQTTCGALLRKLPVPRDPGRLPLIESQFNLERVAAGVRFTDLSVSVDPNPKRFVNTDLFFNLVESESGSLILDCDYNTDLLDPETVKDWLGHFETLLGSIAADPDRPIGSVELLSAGERGLQLAEWNAADDETLSPICIHELFEAQVSRTPDAAALAFEGEALTYRELNDRANQLAHDLIDRGIGPGCFVGLLLERSIDMVVAVLAVLKAGAAYVPVDPAYPKERVRLMLEDAGIAALLTHERADPPSLSSSIPVLRLERERERLSRSSVFNPGRRAVPDDLAYLIYTSGSTGRPKGVEIPHYAVTNLLRSMARQVGVTDRDTLLAITSISFDISALELLLPLAVGGRVFLATREAAIDGALLLRALSDSCATVLQGTPASWRLLLDAGWRSGRPLKMLCGGEALPRELAEQLLERGGRLWNLYGPTETTIWSAAGRVESCVGPILIGPPIANTSLLVLDRRRQLLPIGVPGELYIGGAGLACGYHRQAELTADRFVADPFSPDTGARLYRTGDLVRACRNGLFEFLGRLDDQVKIRGFRVEPGEIESALTSHPAVRDCAAILRADERGHSRLVAYVVPRRRESGGEGMERSAAAGVLSHWRAQWDLLYSQAISEGAGAANDAAERDPSLGIVRWTGRAASADEEMREWVDRTVERIAALRPRRVLEIGTGTGLLLRRLAPGCSAYMGTDFSVAAIDFLRNEAAEWSLGECSVTLAARPADDFTGFEKSSFDTVLIHSVVQYFPDAAYLARVLRGAVDVLEPGGVLFVGDVQSLSLLEAYHTGAQLREAADGLSTQDLLRRVRQRIALESELVVHPDFFRVFAATDPRITRAEVRLRRGSVRNETTQYHYDALLEVRGAAPEREATPELLDWETARLSPAALTERLRQGRPERLVVSGIPNARVRGEWRTARLLFSSNPPATAGELRAAAGREDGVDPEEIWQLAERLGYRAELDFSAGHPDAFDASFLRGGESGARLHPGPNTQGCTSETVEALTNRVALGGAEEDLTRELRRHLETRLPAYMIPSVFVAVDELPRTPNGKIDRRALPEPIQTDSFSSAAFVSPRTKEEQTLAEIWRQVLRVDRVGIDDDLFDLGADSLLIFQITTKASQAGLPVNPKMFFQFRTISRLSEHLAAAAREEEEPALPERRSGESANALPAAPPRPLLAPASFSQERIWLIDRIRPGASAYNLPIALRVHGELDVAALGRTINEIIRRHESLRTTFSVVDGRLQQVISPSGTLALETATLSDLPPRDREERARVLCTDAVRMPFDLAAGPLVRVHLWTLESDEHLLLINLHHMIADGWSFDVLLQELEALYPAFRTGRASPLPPVAMQYSEYGRWQREWLSGETLDRHLTYWRERLADLPAASDFPMDHPRPEVQSLRGATETLLLPASLTAAVHAFSQSERVTPFMTLLGAFYAFLHRYTGQTDLVVGSPIANRNREEIQGSIGLFVNTLVLRTDASGDPTIRDLVGRVRDVAVDAFTHQDLPFERLVEELNPPRDPSRNPVFQILFVYQKAFIRPVELPGLTFSPIQLDRAGAAVDFSLFLIEREEGLRAGLEYSSDLFERETARRLLRNFEVLLEAAVASPDLPISALPILSPEERGRVLVEWNQTQEGYSRDNTLHALFEARVDRTPEAVAVVFGDRALTYRELNERANRLARYLVKRGIGPGVPVGLYLERSLEMVVGLLGILKTGGTYVPLDTQYPRERLAFLLTDTGALAVLTQAALCGDLPGGAFERVRLDADWRRISRESGNDLPARAGSESLAYVIYTSGSTGRPKGVEISHGAIANHMFWMQEAFPLGPDDRVLQKTPISFDASVWEFFAPLFAGACLVMARPQDQRDPASLIETIRRNRITVLQVVPSLLRVLLEQKTFGDCTSLKRVFCGGEPLARDLQDRFFGLLGAELYNLYGPTEASVDATSWTCRRRDPRDTVPIGRPIANMRAYVLDAAGQPVPIGVGGELYLAGEGLARGYRNRPELTADRFLPNPVPGMREERVYRTGDLVRWRSDGVLEYLGRADDQIKLRGVRIELGEIEAALAQHPDVLEAAVVARDDGHGGKRLAAYMVARSPVTPRELRRFLAEKLPDYMLPASFTRIDQLPVTSGGKLDRARLPSAEETTEERERDFVAPRDTVEKELARLWEELLDVRPIGIRDHFFELGGHSLLAVRLFAEIEKRFDRTLPLATIFQTPTVELLANLLRAGRPAGVRSTVVSVQPNGTRAPFFCVHAREEDGLADADLSARLGADQPFYTLRANPGNGHSLSEGIEPMADHCFQELRSVQPSGPYILGGVAEGAVVAYEIAQRLCREGETVRLLALFDTRGAREERLKAAAPRPRLLARFLRRTRRYPGRITLFRGRRPEGEADREFESGWSELAEDGIEVYEVPGSDGPIGREPRVRILAEQLKLALGAGGRQGSPSGPSTSRTEYRASAGGSRS